MPESQEPRRALSEYTCQRCGIHVIWAIPQPAETRLCAVCRFIESIDDPDAKAHAEAFLRRLRRAEEGGTDPQCHP